MRSTALVNVRARISEWSADAALTSGSTNPGIPAPLFRLRAHRSNLPSGSAVAVSAHSGPSALIDKSMPREDAVPIVNQVAVGGFVPDELPQILQSPVRARVRSDIDPHKSAATVLDGYEYVEQSEGRSDRNERSRTPQSRSHGASGTLTSAGRPAADLRAASACTSAPSEPRPRCPVSPTVHWQSAPRPTPDCLEPSCGSESATR